MGAKVFAKNDSTFYGYSMLEIRNALNETLVECNNISENPVFSAGVEWAYHNLCDKLCLNDEK